jgi:hypothetical protein
MTNHKNKLIGPIFCRLATQLHTPQSIEVQGPEDQLRACHVPAALQEAEEGLDHTIARQSLRAAAFHSQKPADTLGGKRGGIQPPRLPCRGWTSPKFGSLLPKEGLKPNVSPFHWP